MIGVTSLRPPRAYIEVMIGRVLFCVATILVITLLMEPEAARAVLGAQP